MNSQAEGISARHACSALLESLRSASRYCVRVAALITLSFGLAKAAAAPMTFTFSANVSDSASPTTPAGSISGTFEVDNGAFSNVAVRWINGSSTVIFTSAFYTGSPRFAFASFRGDSSDPNRHQIDLSFATRPGDAGGVIGISTLVVFRCTNPTLPCGDLVSVAVQMGSAQVAANGVCGTAATVTPSTLAATANLCAAGLPLGAAGVSTTATAFNWTCDGVGAGTSSVACTTPRGYVVSANSASPSEGSVTCLSSVVAANASTTCTANPANGYVTARISGCDGVPTRIGENTYQTGAVAADCIVTASFLTAAAAASATAVPALSPAALVALVFALFALAAPMARCRRRADR
jgi:hypothetical protein